MTRNINLLHHRRMRRSLVPYLDGELSLSEAEQMRRHLETCAECRQELAEIRAFREVLRVRNTSPLIPTEQLWQRVVTKTTTPSRNWHKLGEIIPTARLPYLGWSVATIVLFLVGLTLWKNTHNGERTQFANMGKYSAAAIDYGIFLDDMRQEVSAGNFHRRYPAQVVKLAEAQQAIAFPLAAIEALPTAFDLDCVRVLECNGQKCIQFTCVNADKVINIFQHALGQPWTLGKYAVARTPICDVECLLVNAKNLTAVSWQGESSEYLAVGDLAPEEFEQVVLALR